MTPENVIPAYSSLHALGHRTIKDILQGPVVVEEKIDGSQFSMSRVNGVLLCRSKGQQIVVDAPEKLFERAVESPNTFRSSSRKSTASNGRNPILGTTMLLKH